MFFMHQVDEIRRTPYSTSVILRRAFYCLTYIFRILATAQTIETKEPGKEQYLGGYLSSKNRPNCRLPFALLRSDGPRHTVLGRLVRVVLCVHTHLSRQRPARLQPPRAATPDAFERTLEPEIVCFSPIIIIKNQASSSHE